MMTGGVPAVTKDLKNNPIRMRTRRIEIGSMCLISLVAPVLVSYEMASVPVTYVPTIPSTSLVDSDTMFLMSGT